MARLKPYLLPLLIYTCTFLAAATAHWLVRGYINSELMQIIFWLFLGVMFAIYISRFGKGEWKVWRYRQPTLKQAGLIAAVLLLFAINNYYIATGTSENKLGDDIQSSIVMSMLVFAISSTGEEIVYRGFLQTYINRKINRTKVISNGNIFATTLMVLSHAGFYTVISPLFATISLLLVLVFSLLAGYLRDSTNGIILPIIVHILVNYVHTAVQAMYA